MRLEVIDSSAATPCQGRDVGTAGSALYRIRFTKWKIWTRKTMCFGVELPVPGSSDVASTDSSSCRSAQHITPSDKTDKAQFWPAKPRQLNRKRRSVVNLPPDRHEADSGSRLSRAALVLRLKRGPGPELWMGWAWESRGEAWLRPRRSGHQTTNGRPRPIRL